MKKKRNEISSNYLERKPKRHSDIKWSVDEKGIVTLEIENVGWANRIAQKFFKRPKVSYVHLDEVGSFVWPLLDGEKDILALGVDVEGRFGEKAKPLYERLAQFFKVLDSYHFIVWTYIPESEKKKSK